MELMVASLSDVGRSRSVNEDSLVCDPHLGLFAVCDGMGGHNAGEVASALCREILLRELADIEPLRQQFIADGQPNLLSQMQGQLQRALMLANREIYQQAQSTQSHSGMGTTCTAVLICGRYRAAVAHVGDCRLYVQRRSHMLQLTRDHSYVTELAARAAVSPSNASNHPHVHVLSRAIGVLPSVAADTFVVTMDPDDTFLVCSDGLHQYFPAASELLPHLQGEDVTVGLRELVDLALERGGQDNCTGIAWRVLGGTQRPALESHSALWIAQLRKLALFKDLPAPALMAIAGCAFIEHCPGGTSLPAAHYSDEYLLLVLAGEVIAQDDAGAQQSLLPGASVGEFTALTGQLEGRALFCAKDTTLLLIPRSSLQSLVLDDPYLGVHILSNAFAAQQAQAWTARCV